MVRFLRISVVGALTVFVVAGCGAASHHRSATQPGNFPVVVTHPKVQSSGIPSADVRGLQADEAVLLSPSKVAFLTSGSIRCVWWPARLTVLGPSEIRVDMRVNGSVTDCGSGAVGFPIAVKIDPRVVDVSRPVTLRLAHKVRLGGRTRRWTTTAVAPAIGTS
jgi:hypothetical protein